MELYLYFLPNLPDELPLLCDLTHETRNSPVQVHVFTFITNATKKGGRGKNTMILASAASTSVLRVLL